MKIAMISEHANPLAALGDVDAGGQNVHVAELSAALVRAGHQVAVYTRRDDPDQDLTVRAPAGYRVVQVPAGPAERLPKDELLPHMGEFGEFLEGAWHDGPPDIVHAHFWMSGLAMVAAAYRTGIPTVQTYHALGVVKRRHLGDRDTSPPTRIDLETRLGHEVDRIVATCSDEVFELRRLGVPRSKISIVPCGVDLSLFTPDGPSRRRAGLPHRVVTVGRLVTRKGFDTAIAALAQVPDTEMIIAGGPESNRFDQDAEVVRLRDLARRVGVDDRVVFAGQVAHTDMPALLRSADAVLCTPAYEPFGIVPLEAMGCARPVIASAVGGLTDTVIDQTTGFLIPPGDTDRLAERMRLLTDDARRADDLGRAGHERVTGRYSWDRIAADTAKAYRTTITSVISSTGPSTTGMDSTVPPAAVRPRPLHRSANQRKEHHADSRSQRSLP